MREIVFIQIGQCGNKVGEKFWETISDEHMIDGCGKFYGSNILPYQRLNVYYETAQNNRFVPRCIIADLEATQVYAVRSGAVGKLFNPDYIITGSQGAGNNWAKGFYTEGAELMDKILDVTRKQAENCDCLQGFQMVHSIGGGSGAGMGSLMLNRLHEEYKDRIVNTFSVIPSGKVSETVVEPYNAVLTLNELISNTDETIVFDNEALFDISLKTLKLEKPRFDDLNHLISMAMSGVTSSLRFPGQLNTDLRKLMTNMCPFPRLKFFIPGYAPLYSKTNTSEYSWLTTKTIVNQLFSPGHQMAAVDSEGGKYLTCAAMFRGLVSSKEFEQALVEVQRSQKEKFVSWIPNNIKSAICDIPPKCLSTAATFLANTTGINLIFERILEQFDSMFYKKAFVHWYTGEGMDEDEFKFARNEIISLCEDYAEAGCSHGDEDDIDHIPQTSDLDSDGCSICSGCDGPTCTCECTI